MSSYFLCNSGNNPDHVPLPHTDQSHSAPFSSENGAQGGDSDAWQCTPPQSTSPSGETPAHTPPSQPGSRPCSRPASQSPSPPSGLTGTKKRISKPAHMRRNIRYFNLTADLRSPWKHFQPTCSCTVKLQMTDFCHLITQNYFYYYQVVMEFKA